MGEYERRREAVRSMRGKGGTALMVGRRCTVWVFKGCRHEDEQEMVTGLGWVRDL